MKQLAYDTYEFTFHVLVGEDIDFRPTSVAFVRDNNQENSLNNPENLSSELNKLNELLKAGVLTQEEFEKAKKRLLDNWHLAQKINKKTSHNS